MRDSEGTETGDLDSVIWSHRNWGRWGANDQMGAANMITPAKRIQACKLVKQGRSVSLARSIPTQGILGAPPSLSIEVNTLARGNKGAVTERIDTACHGLSLTHMDALCHIWSERGMWNGHDANKEINAYGVGWGDINQWAGEGIITRGILFDVPAFRKVPYVEVGNPVTDNELRAIARVQGITPEPGDALIIYSGREKWDCVKDFSWGTNGDSSMGGIPSGQETRPGLDVSSLLYIREVDCSLLIWDMMDALPDPGGRQWPVHSALFLFGVGLIDNAHLSSIADACREAGRYEFMLAVAPLPIEGASGCLVNPIACL